MTFLDLLRSKKASGKKSFAILVDPDDVNCDQVSELCKYAAITGVDYFFVGGSLLLDSNFEEVIKQLKDESDLPVLIFPGNNLQVSDRADGILLLSLLSGRNPEYLIGQHVVAAPRLKAANIEIISTAYIIIDGGNTTAVSYMSNTMPIPADKTSIATCTALAGEMLGMSCVYLETGSGAKTHVPLETIKSVASQVNVPIIVGGGIKKASDLAACYNAGADLVVVGTSIEKNPSFLNEVAKVISQYK